VTTVTSPRAGPSERRLLAIASTQYVDNNTFGLPSRFSPFQNGSFAGKCCNFERPPEIGLTTVKALISSGYFEELVDELNLTPDIVPIRPPNLPLPYHIDGFVTVNRSPCRLEFSEALLGVHAAFDRSVVLLQNIVQVLHGSVPTAAAKGLEGRRVSWLRP
jgi:hypothetical protein